MWRNNNENNKKSFNYIDSFLYNKFIFSEYIKSRSSNIKWDAKSNTNIFEDLVDLGSILTTIGAGVLVAVTLYMGIKYITATPEAQAKLKQQLIGLVVSGFVIFGAYFIWKIVISIVEKF